MDTEVNLVGTARLLLLEHVGFMLIVQELNDRHPRVAVVDIVSKPGRVNDGKANCTYEISIPWATYIGRSRCTLEELFLELSFRDSNLDLSCG
jgi:hypothetical protein